MDSSVDRGREVAHEVIDRIASDPAFCQAMKDDPAAALESAGYMHQVESADADVEGFQKRQCPYSCWSTKCFNWATL